MLDLLDASPRVLVLEVEGHTVHLHVDAASPALEECDDVVSDKGSLVGSPLVGTREEVKNAFFGLEEGGGVSVVELEPGLQVLFC